MPFPVTIKASRKTLEILRRVLEDECPSVDEADAEAALATVRAWQAKGEEKV